MERVSTLKSCYPGVSIWSSLHQGSLSLESPSLGVSPSGDVPPRFPLGESPFWKFLLLETPRLRGNHSWGPYLEGLYPGESSSWGSQLEDFPPEGFNLGDPP